MLIEWNVKRLGLSFERDWDSWPEATRKFVAEYGVRQFVNDGHASITAASHPDEVIRSVAVGERVASRIEQLDTGNVPGTRAPADPLAAKRREFFKKAHDAGMSDTEAFAVLEEAIAKKRAA